MALEGSMSKAAPDPDPGRSLRALETPLESVCHLLYLAGHIDTKPEERERHIRRAEEHLQEMVRIVKRGGGSLGPVS
jgi:hypothetical protein